MIDHNRRMDVVNNTNVPYVVKEKKHALEKDNTIVVKNEGFFKKLKRKLFNK